MSRKQSDLEQGTLLQRHDPSDLILKAKPHLLIFPESSKAPLRTKPLRGLLQIQPIILICLNKSVNPWVVGTSNGHVRLDSQLIFVFSFNDYVF